MYDKNTHFDSFTNVTQKGDNFNICPFQFCIKKNVTPIFQSMNQIYEKTSGEEDDDWPKNQAMEKCNLFVILRHSRKTTELDHSYLCIWEARLWVRVVTIRETRGTNKKGIYGNKIPEMKRNGCSLSSLTRNNFVL